MANDSPAKSLVDIDLASLRVSAAEPSLWLLLLGCFANFYLTLLDKGPLGRTETSKLNAPCSSLALVAAAERLEMTVEP